MRNIFIVPNFLLKLRCSPPSNRLGCKRHDQPLLARGGGGKDFHQSFRHPKTFKTALRSNLKLVLEEVQSLFPAPNFSSASLSHAVQVARQRRDLLVRFRLPLYDTFQTMLFMKRFVDSLLQNDKAVIKIYWDLLCKVCA